MARSIGEHGVYDVTTPLPGTYTIGENEVTISVEDVLGGTFRSSFDGEGEAYWSFDEGSGDVAYDRAGGRHAAITNGEWVEGVQGSAIAFDGEGYGEARPMEGSTNEFTVSAWIKPESESSGAILSTGKDGGRKSNTGVLFDHGLSGWLTDRLGLYLGSGSSNFNFHSPELGLEYPTESYHHVAAVFNRGSVSWYFDGEQLGEEMTDLQQVEHTGGRSSYIGREYSGYGGQNPFHGSIDELRYYETALSIEELRSLR
jgi:dolichyl-diphosphooligosaccharide--protein glycosyltransferase